MQFTVFAHLEGLHLEGQEEYISVVDYLDQCNRLLLPQICTPQ